MDPLRPMTLNQRDQKRRLSLNLILVIGLSLRFAESWIPLLFPVDFQLISDWSIFVFVLLTYLFILINIEHLADYFMDKLSVYMILIACPLRCLLLPFLAPKLRSLASFPGILALLTILVSVGMFFYLFLNKKFKVIPNHANTKWLFVGAFLGISLNILFGYLIATTTPNARVYTGKLDHTVFLNFLYQIGYSSAYEEPLFRSMLLGKSGSTNKRFLFVNLLQALLFSLAHGHLLYPSLQVLPVLSILITGFLYGYVVKASKSISTTMIAHATYNGFGYFTGIILAGLFR